MNSIPTASMSEKIGAPSAQMSGRSSGSSTECTQLFDKSTFEIINHTAIATL